MNISGIMYIFLENGISKGIENVRPDYLLNNDSQLEWLHSDCKEFKTYSFLEDCFFISFRSMDLSIISIFDYIENLNDDLNRMNEMIKTHTYDESDNQDINEFMTNFNIDRMKLAITKLQDEKKKNNELLNNFILLSWYSKFINNFTNWLNNLKLITLTLMKFYLQ